MSVPATSRQDEARRRLLSLQDPDETDGEFAERVGLTPQAVSNYKNGHHGLSIQSALNVHEAHGVSLDWLLAGRGSPRLAAERENGGRPYESGGRYVYDRLLRSVLEMTDSVVRAGMISDEEAGAIRAPLERYLDRSSPGVD